MQCISILTQQSLMNSPALLQVITCAAFKCYTQAAFPVPNNSIFDCVLVTWWWHWTRGFQIKLDRMCCGDFLSFSAEHAMQALQGTDIFILPSCRANVEAHAPYNWNVLCNESTCSWYTRSQNSTWTNRLNLIHFLLLLSHLQWSNCLVTPNATRTTGPLTN